jgi:polar amino acid transport system substrate-binding protein
MKYLRWFLIFSFFFTPLVQAGEIERIQAKGELVVSLNKGYPPFSMVIDNKLQGLDVDLAALLAEYLGVRVRFVQPATYDRQIPTLLSGEADIIIAAMTRTVERGLKVSFTTPYFEVSQAALVMRELATPDSDSYFDLVDIKGLTLGVKADTTHERQCHALCPDRHLLRPDV